MQRFYLIPVLLAAVFLAGCSSLDMPKGTSKGYSSARFIEKQTSDSPRFAESSPKVNGMIQKAIVDQFQMRNMPVGGASADLVIAYLLIIQNNVATTSLNDYYGYGGEASKIVDQAHELGVNQDERREYYEQGAIVIDLIDAKTNELIYRNYAKRETIENLSDAARQQRINEAVAEALAAFFK